MQILVCMRVLPAYLYEDSPVRLAADEWMKKGHRAIGFYFVDEFDASCLAYVKHCTSNLKGGETFFDVINAAEPHDVPTRSTMIDVLSFGSAQCYDLLAGMSVLGVGLGLGHITWVKLWKMVRDI